MFLYCYESFINGRSITYSLKESDGFITEFNFLTPEQYSAFKNSNQPENSMILNQTKLIKQAHDELDSYFNGRNKIFSVPFKAAIGTEFMHKVWDALCDIPYGETATYSEIAEKIGSKKACRAVGLANNRNPLGIFVPCHRVIGKNGTLTVYAGGLDIKSELLKLEKNSSTDQAST